MYCKPAVPTPQMDYSRAVITGWRFETGAETGSHVHVHDYVIVPIADCELLVETGSRGRTSRLKASQNRAGERGIGRNVVDAGTQPAVVVGIEIL